MSSSSQSRLAVLFRQLIRLALAGPIVIAGMFVFWEIFVRVFQIQQFVLPAPSAIFEAMWQWRVPILENSWQTLMTTLIGFAFAIVIGGIGGVALGSSRVIYDGFYPALIAFNSVPKVAVIPVLVIWFGIGSGSKVFIVFLSATLPILVNTIAGVRNIDPDLLKAARAFCAKDRQIFVTVALPSSVPFILTGVRQGIALGLIGAIIGELFAGSEGIGYMISYAGQMFQTDTLLVGVVVVAAAGMMLTAAAERARRHLWAQRHHLGQRGWGRAQRGTQGAQVAQLDLGRGVRLWACHACSSSAAPARRQASAARDDRSRTRSRSRAARPGPRAGRGRGGAFHRASR